jgi:siderophore synthetase component
MPKLNNNEQLVPMFSLYATSKEQHSSMLQQIISKSEKGYREFVKDNIIVPMTRHMLQIYFEDGLIMEPHEQNVLIKMKNGKLTGQFYYRDFAGFHFDDKARLMAGKDMNFLPKSFQYENLKIGRANIIENIKSYLIQSNFYAMKKSVETNSINNHWIEKVVFEVVQEEIKLKTGHNVNSWQTAKSAITKLKTKTSSRSCAKLFGG